MAYTAASLVNGDHIKAYLAGEEPEEYARTKRILDAYCHRMSVSLIYVIDVDQSDYERFVSVFNAVDNTVDDSNYVPWEIGHKRETTNEEYRPMRNTGRVTRPYTPRRKSTRPYTGCGREMD